MSTNRYAILRRRAILGLLALTLFAGAATAAGAPSANAASPRTEIATFAGGCFWSLDAIFERLKGVRQVTAGFSGGGVKSPSYERVCTGTTGHAETVQIEFDPSVISYDDLLGVFFEFHDPTTPNRQGADVGTQYRSVIFTRSLAQRAAALRAISEYERTHRGKVVTQVQPYAAFYPAEGYHQDYYDRNESQGYCRFVIAPKVEKLRKLHGDRLKSTKS